MTSLTPFVRRRVLQSLSRTTTISRPFSASSRRADVAAGTADINAVEEAQKQSTQPQESEGWLYVSSIFPIRLGTWDVRYYVGSAREDTLLTKLSDILSHVKAQGFRVVSVEPHPKDGGVFVKFNYTRQDGSDSSLNAILRDIKETSAKRGGLPSWMPGWSHGDAWVVKGNPWKEDMNHYASPLLKISFDGPDLRDETLYNLLRPYGRIVTITPPSPVPAGTLRSAVVNFRSIQSATIARNTLHGLAIPADSGSGITRIRTFYQQPIQAHAVRDYVSSHPKIFLPVFIFLLGTLTYTVFDPIRVFMVEGKLEDWFDFRQYKAYKWLRSNAIDYFYDEHPKDGAQAQASWMDTWKERQDAQGAVNRYLSDLPNTVMFIHGPQGSGKSRLIKSLLKDSDRKALIIDVAALGNVTSDVALVTGLAQQTGYWPVFSFLNSMNNLIDLASVGLIGQKAGLSSSLADQLKQILEVVGTGLQSVNTTYRKNHKKELKRERLQRLQEAEDARQRQRILEGTWHDGRLDCVAGNGAMSELGIGDELMGEADMDAPKTAEANVSEGKSTGNEKVAAAAAAADDKLEKIEEEEDSRKQISEEDLQAIEAMPIVILQGFQSKSGNARREELLNELATWAAALAENHVAHVIVVSDNRENAKQLARALPSKPLNTIALSDADSSDALKIVQSKLQDAGVDLIFNKEQTAYLERVGGRASDLESIIHKIRSGMSVQEAVDDIIAGGVSELRKRAFGDDVEDAKNLAWTREQAWVLMKQLAKKPEVAYHEVLIDFPFKGDETPLRQLEHAELIAINMTNGRPSSIRPGKPIYRSVFEKLVHGKQICTHLTNSKINDLIRGTDPTFQATQDIAFNEKIIAANETIIKACEAELMTLKEVEAGTSHWWGSRRAVTAREEYLLKKMRVAQEKVEILDKQNVSLKKVLSKLKS
ncbi:exonuclease [Irpex rosettiformis]|uniref:Exonuclease n=1 Tax=Irpex rosettiformis TaxID=378272 RepID=A0ACB8TU09_9APHY|nr:exonuclease [Irpex rosettiformis]